ncbi:MAG: AlwI family type II restriction endonuclease, partial [Candidatus Alkaliphilus sp. MAG34]
MGKATLEDIIYEDLMDMENYRLAYKTFMSNRLSEELICLVGMNRKSRNYDRPYCNLLVELIRVFHHGEEERAYDLFLAAKKISHKPGMLWRNVIFTTSVAGNIRKNGIKTVREDCIFKKTKSEREIKTTFYKYMHVFKAMATLADYFDLNRRYFNLTDTLIFEDNIVKFDLIPKYFFKECIEKVYKEGFTENVYLKDSVPTEQISSHLIFDEKIIYSKISKDLGIIIKTPEQATTFIRDERYRRFNRLIDSKFSDKVLLELLSCFEARDDARIEELVTDEANTPTIFEYITGIVWYKVSERQGDILEYMKLSLEPNLLPKAHATGGSADIIYEYSACRDFPKHSLLIEATLSEGTSQRRMEMEPVSRHLGEFLLKSNNPFDYTLFISTYLHKNVMADFRGRKYMQYYGNGDEIVDGMKIISLDTGALKIIINKNIKYRYLYKVFDKYYESDEPRLFEWQDNLIKKATQTYIDSEAEF